MHMQQIATLYRYMKLVGYDAIYLPCPGVIHVYKYVQPQYTALIEQKARTAAENWTTAP